MQLCNSLKGSRKSLTEDENLSNPRLELMETSSAEQTALEHGLDLSLDSLGDDS